MSLSGLLRAAWVAVPAALVCGGAVAQQIITVPSGVVVILTPGGMPGGAISAAASPPVMVEARRVTPVAVSPLAAPDGAIQAASLERIFAEQQAMMDHMMADMNAMFSPRANPMGMLPAMAGAMPASAGTFCEESVSINYNGQGSAPVVKVSRAGGGCGPAAGIAPVPADATPPVVARPSGAHRPAVIQINGPARVTLPASRQHRT